MAVNFVFGSVSDRPAGPVQRRIFSESRRSPEKIFYVLVPEQSTLQEERAWMTASPDHVLANIQVVSFTGLAYRVLDEREVSPGTLLDDTGKAMILRRILREKADALPSFRREQDKPGFAGQLAQAMDELSLSCAEPALLDQILADAKLPQSLCGKLADLSAVREEFTRQLGTKYSTAESLLEKLAALIPASSLFSHCEVVVTGFTSFRQRQMRVIEQLMLRAENMTVIGNCRIAGGRPDLAHFPMFAQTLREIRELAQKYGIPFAGRMPEEGSARSFPAELHFLEQTLFRPEEPAWPREPERIFMVRAADPEEEVRFAAAMIRKTVRETGCRYNEIGLVIGDSADYRNLLTGTFAQAGIPLYLDRKSRLSENPLAEYISALLQAMQEDFSYPSVLCVLRNPLCPIDPEHADLLDNYLVASGIRGRSAYEKDWPWRFGHITEEKLAQVNAVRAEVCDLFRPLCEAFLPRDREESVSVRDGCTRLVLFLESTGCPEKMEELRRHFADAGDVVRESEYRQAYEAVMNLLDQTVGLMGEDRLELSLFAETLTTGFEAMKVGTVPVTFDRVVAADLERSRIQNVRLLFFLGVNDGVLPAGHDAGGILTDADRELLREAGLPLLPTAAEREFQLEEYLCLMCSRASEKILFSCALRGRDGKEIRPSWLFSEMTRLFPGLRIRTPGEVISGADRLISPGDALRVFVEEIEKSLTAAERGTAPVETASAETAPSGSAPAGIEPDWQSIAKWLYRNNPALLSRTIEGLTYRWQPRRLTVQTARALFGREQEIRVTGLEDYAACAYRHYLQAGLGLQERVRPSVRAADLGTVFHDALSEFFSVLREQSLDFASLTEEELRDLAETCVQKAVEKQANPVFAASARGRYTVRRAARMTGRTLWALQQQWKSGQYQRTFSEYSFSRARNSSIRIPLSDGSSADLAGRSDRMDLAETAHDLYVRIIDYKSGHVEFDAGRIYYGLTLQLLLYLDALSQMLQKWYPDKTVIPAGAYYYDLADPLIDAAGAVEDLVETKRLRELRMTGITSTEGASVSLADADGTGNVVKGLEEKKDGTLKASAKVADRRQMQWLIRLARRRASALADRMFQGDITADPKEYGGLNPCDFCDARESCDFTPGSDGCRVQELEKLTLSDLWKKEEEEDGNHVDGGSE